MISVYVFMFLSLFVSITLLYAFVRGLRRQGGVVEPGKTVSVVIPVYNEEKSVAKTIDSVLALDYPKHLLQIIVVNDGSTDRTGEIIAEYVSKGVEVYTKKNQGCKAYPVNYGLQFAKGEFIFQLDADSYPRPDTIKKMLWYFKDPEVMGVAPSHHIWRPNNFWLKLQVFEFSLSSFIRKGLDYLGALNVTPSGAMYRKWFLDKYGNFDTSTIVEDFEMGMRIKAKRYKTAHALDTRIDVVSPSRFVALFKQRLRWAYGHLQVFRKYGYMFSFKYGDLGFFYLPVSFLFMFTPFLMFLRLLWKYGKELFLQTSMFSDIGYDFQYSFSNYNFTYTYQPYHFIVVVSVLLAVVTYLVVKHVVAPDYSFGGMFVVYLFFYLIVLAVFNVTAAVFYVFGKAPSWISEKKHPQFLKRNCEVS